MNLRFFKTFGLFACLSASVIAGPKGTVRVPNIADGAINIDGDFSDWNLPGYTTPAQQPVFPNALEAAATDAFGDHIVWDAQRVGGFNNTIIDDLDPDSPSEFGSAIYLKYDTNFLYVLGVFLDDELQADRDETGFSNFLNDGFEMFFDSLGDSLDPADEASFPAFDTIDDEEDLGVTANTDDFQLTVGLNSFFEADAPGPDEIGARQHLERGGDREVIKPFYNDEVLESTDFSSTGGRNIAAKAYSDLGAAGARNPEILASPETTFEGYAVELAMPFGFTEGFTPDHNMGFNIFWRDVDDPDAPGPGFGGAGIMWTDWVQSTQVQSSLDETFGLFHTGTWGQLEFVSGNPFDLDGSGALDVGDLDALNSAIKTNDTDARFDINGDGNVNATDLVALASLPEGFNSYVGDANLDGEFNSGDLVQVFSAGEYEDTAVMNSTWGTGDWNGDGEFNSGDLVAAFSQGGYEQGPRGASPAVPEPSAAALLLIGIAGLLRRRT